MTLSLCGHQGHIKRRDVQEVRTVHLNVQEVDRDVGEADRVGGLLHLTRKISDERDEVVRFPLEVDLPLDCFVERIA